MSEWVRVQPPKVMTDMYPGARAWQKEVADGHLSAFRTMEQFDGQSGPWRTHVSVSHRTNDQPPVPGRYPTWDEQKEAVWKFAPGRVMISILPPEGSPYINLHPTTFHWWEMTP